MDTLFLFTKHLNQEGCFSLKCSANGALIAPPAQRSFAEILSLQEESATQIVETSANASFFSLELPWLPDRKARIAIPYALEEKLAQPVEELHFVFDKGHYHNNHYLITVISKQRMHYIMHLLAEQNIAYQGITLDWFALEPEEVCVSEATLLLYVKEYQGALSGNMADNYLKKNQLIHPPILFSDSQLRQPLDIPVQEKTSYEWIAQRLLQSDPVNLCQGEMQHGTKLDWVKKSYQIAGILFSLWLISLICVNAINLYCVNKETTRVDEQIAKIYHEFFPDAKQVISPKFRISQLLKGNANDEQNRFWTLLNQFSKIIDSKKFTIEQIHYQNKTLSITLLSPDFAALEQLEKALKQSQLHVKQTQASTREQQVAATLELM